jgi:hypothetical protein
MAYPYSGIVNQAKYRFWTRGRLDLTSKQTFINTRRGEISLVESGITRVTSWSTVFDPSGESAIARIERHSLTSDDNPSLFLRVPRSCYGPYGAPLRLIRNRLEAILATAPGANVVPEALREEPLREEPNNHRAWWWGLDVKYGNIVMAWTADPARIYQHTLTFPRGDQWVKFEWSEGIPIMTLIGSKPEEAALGMMKADAVRKSFEPGFVHQTIQAEALEARLEMEISAMERAASFASSVTQE